AHALEPGLYSDPSRRTLGPPGNVLAEDAGLLCADPAGGAGVFYADAPGRGSDVLFRQATPLDGDPDLYAPVLLYSDDVHRSRWPPRVCKGLSSPVEVERGLDTADRFPSVPALAGNWRGARNLATIDWRVELGEDRAYRPASRAVKGRRSAWMIDRA